MKFWLWSDTHLEVQNLAFPASAPAGVDAILCPGDLCSADELKYQAQWIIDKYNLPLILVPGNHEFYREKTDSSPSRSMASDRKILAAASEASKQWKQRLHVLDNDTIEFGDIRIIGGTLWIDFEMDIETLSDIPWRMNDAPSMLADFSRIRIAGNDMLTPQIMLDLHRETRTYIRNKLAEPFAGRTLVMTHHLPHPHCTPNYYRGGKANFMYASGKRAFDDVLNSNDAPSYWLCGHTHHPFDIAVGNTRIVCNPAGYLVAKDERQSGFSWDVVIDTEMEN